MAVYNEFSCLKRKQLQSLTSRKKRKTTSSTVAAQTFAEDAMDAFYTYVLGYKKIMLYLLLMTALNFDFQSEPGRYFGNFFLLAAWTMATKAQVMLQLDLDLLDLHEENDQNADFHKELMNITLDSYKNDDEFENNMHFSKEEILTLMDFLGFGDGMGFIRVYYNGPVYYKFWAVTLFIYMLRKMSTGRTHKDLPDNEFGVDSSRWGRGYKWMVKYVDRRSHGLIGPRVLELWAPQFNYFAEIIREYIMRDKERVDLDGNHLATLNMGGLYIASGTFNIFSVTDCTFYEICRPGSGPANDSLGAPRRHNWYVKQRAFYSRYQRGMEACIKLLTICLPNGMCGAVYGPTSGRQDDRTLFRLAQFDEYLPNGSMYSFPWC
jgi:hypothetical protein